MGSRLYIYKKKLDKACFAGDAVYADSEDLAERAVSVKIFKHRDYEITLTWQCDGYQRGLTIMVCKCFHKNIGSKANLSAVLAQELHKPVFKKFERRKV